MTEDESESFLVHARTAASLSRDREAAIRGLVSKAIARYQEDRPTVRDEEYARLTRIVENLDKALATVLVHDWPFDDPAPFHNETSALAWLNGGKANLWLDGAIDWLGRNLWEVRKDFDGQLADLMGYAMSRAHSDWPRLPKNTSHLPPRLQGLLSDLCHAWCYYVDSELRLPRRDSNPTNPLLRFLYAGLALAIEDEDQRPAMKALLQFVGRQIRPTLRAERELLLEDH